MGGRAAEGVSARLAAVVGLVQVVARLGFPGVKIEMKKISRSRSISILPGVAALVGAEASLEPVVAALEGAGAEAIQDFAARLEGSEVGRAGVLGKLEGQQDLDSSCLVAELGVDLG